MDISIDIADYIDKIAKRDPKALVLKVSELNLKDRTVLLKSLEKLEKEVGAKRKKDKEKEDKPPSKKEEEKKFIQRLKIKLEDNSRNDVVIRTQFDSLEKLLKTINEDRGISDAEAIQQFKKLVELVGDIDIIKCLANFAQGRLVNYLKGDKTLAQVANMLGIGMKFTERLSNFGKFGEKHKGLLYTGYSMETLLKYKRAIEKHCEEDVNFATLATNDPEATYQPCPPREDPMDEDDLLEDYNDDEHDKRKKFD